MISRRSILKGEYGHRMIEKMVLGKVFSSKM
jgi:hypothetical protein